MADRSRTAYIFNHGWIFRTLLVVFFVGLNPLNPVLAESGQPKHEGSHAKATDKPRVVDNPRVVKEGITIEFDFRPADEDDGNSAVIERQKAKARFTITDQATGAPLRGLFPSAWMDRVKPDKKELDCKKKIQSFVQARLGYLPTQNLNTWHILAMNEKASISVIDPLIETGASQMLLDLIILNSPGEAWILDRPESWLYVTMPKTNEVAVVNTITWDVTANLKVGAQPSQIAFQPDGAYLWVGIDGVLEGESKSGGVAVIKPETRKIVARIPTGKGHHEIAFSNDSRFAYITNEGEGTVSVIDVGRLKKIKEIKVGSRPSSLAYSISAQSLYVLDSAKGMIHVVDGKNHNEVASVVTRAGTATIRFSPDGRWGFVANKSTNKVMVLDASINSIAHSFDVGKGSAQMAFIDNYAIIHSVEEAKISLIGLSSLSKRGSIPVVQIPVGKVSEKTRPVARANTIAVTPEDSSILVSNAEDMSVYFYMEGMNAPMGSFGNFRRRPKAVLAVDKGLRETSPGVYETDLKLMRSGKYDVAFLLDTPQITHCFTTHVKVDPDLQDERGDNVQVELLTMKRNLPVGKSMELRVRLTDGVKGSLRNGVKDLRALIAHASGTWQQRIRVNAAKNGEYVANISLPRPGTYNIYFASNSLKKPYRYWPRFIVKAKHQTNSEKH